MKTLPIIETERLRLRPLEVRDASDYHRLEVDPEVKRFLGGPTSEPASFYRTQLASGALSQVPIFAVTLNETGTFVGRCGFTENDLVNGWEINIVLAREHWGKGFGTETGSVLIPFGFGFLATNVIFGVADAANTSSIRLCEKLRMEHQPQYCFTKKGRPLRIFAVRKASSPDN